ncbi:MAG: DoxX family protein [Acidobacteria bacterium]|nr:DoxX family protein [Acidobacteriota bacterium]
MERVLGRFAPQIYAALRIVAGLMFACHGAQKLFGAFGGQQMPVASMIGVAGIIELVGGLLIAIGLFASIAAFISSGEMAAAYFMAHAAKAPLPIENGGELAALYCFLFLYIAARGPGVWAVERAPRRGPDGNPRR